MLDALAELCDAGRLLGVTHVTFEGDPMFVTAVALRFESLTALFEAVSEDDTLAVRIGAPPEATGVDASAAPPWAECVGRAVRWAWRMTNQQGYTDGARLEFAGTGHASATVECVVAASAVRVFVAREAVPLTSGA